MDTRLANEFAKILDEAWAQPNLGLATTAELIDELRARIEVEGLLQYRTVDPVQQTSGLKFVDPEE